MHFREAILYVSLFGAAAVIILVCGVGLLVWLAGGRARPLKKD